MGLLDSRPEEPHPKRLRYIVTAVALAVLMAISLGYVFRFHTEKRTVEQFLQALAAGSTQQAYRLWKPQPTYSYPDFLQDWGPSGYYGPIKSYRIKDIRQPSGGSGVVVTVDVSLYQPFPADNNVEQSRQNKEVRIWVEFSDQSLSFPP